MDRTAVNEGWHRLAVVLNGLRPCWDLCRLPQAVLVAADPLAGALIAGARWPDLPLIALLMLGAGMLHAGASALNDWHDFKSDRVEQPDRPIPAGRVGRWFALLVAALLLGGGWAFISIPGMAAGQIGLVILCCVLVHEFMLKRAPVAKAVPAIARAFALLLGMTLVPAGPPPGVVPLVSDSTASPPLRIFFMSILGVYALGAIVLAHRSADRERVAFGVAGGIVAGVPLAALALTRVLFPQEVAHPSAAVWIGLLLVVAGLPVAWAIWRPGERASRRAGWTATLGTALVEAAMVAFVRGPLVSLPVVACMAAAVHARRWLDREQIPAVPSDGPHVAPADVTPEPETHMSSLPH